jgi:hypothetical protein
MLTSNDYVLDESEARLGWLEPVPESERSDHDALWRRLRTDGYILLRDHLPVDLVTEFRRFYFEALAETGLVDPQNPGLGLAGDSEVDRAALRRVIFDHIIPSPEYEALCTHPGIRDWFRWLLDDDVHCTSARSCGTPSPARTASAPRRRRTTTSSTCAKAATGCCRCGFRSATVRPRAADSPTCRAATTG